MFTVFLLLSFTSCGLTEQTVTPTKKQTRRQKRKAKLKETCVCYEIYAPVCAEGKTFANDCFARCEGYTRFKNGACSL